MFEFIRTHQRLMQFVLLLLILPSFAFFGIEGYMRMASTEGTIAKVGGVAISQEEFDGAQREQIQRLQQQLGSGIDPKVFETPEMKTQVLESLIRERALAYEIARSNLMVTDDKLRSTIAAIPSVQENGAFSSEKYATLLAAQGMTPPMFEARLRRDLSTQILTNVLQESTIVPKTVAKRITDIVMQQREVAEQTFKPADFAAQVKVTDELRKQYYDSHGQEFEIAQQLRIEYLVLNGDAAAKQVSVTPEAIAEYYAQNKKRYEAPEQRRASHILINAAKDASDADKKKARATAEEVLAKVKAAPNDFAKLAKQYSQDPGSAEKGGDLDYFSRGAMVPQFDEVVFKMRLNETSALVQSDFGFHIIRLSGIKAAAGKSLAEVKGEIEGEITKQLASRKFAELAEQFINAVYDQSDSLKPAADKLKLTIQTADGVTRAPVDAKAPWANAKLLAALFGDEALKNKRNTEAVEIAPGTLVSARVLENKPATRRPLDEVKDQVTARIVAVESAKLARTAGDARLAALRGGAAASDFGKPKLVTRGKGEGLAPEGLAMVFKAETASLPSYTGAELSAGGYAVYRISRVVQADAPDAAQTANITQNLARQAGEVEFAAYLDNIKKRAKVEVLKPVTDSKSAVLQQ